MLESFTFFTWILLLNSLVTIGLILNQNETAKDLVSNQTSENGLEKITWICLFFQLILFFIQLKLTL